MAEGLRDAFVENDTFGNYAADTRLLGSRSTRKRHKKSKKSRRKVKHSVRRRRGNRKIKRTHNRNKQVKKGRKYPHWLKKYWFKKRK